MSSIFELQHFYEDEDGYDIDTYIAVYSTQAKAEAAMENFRMNPKFAMHPNNFNIDEYKLDEDHWIEGFFIVE